MLPAARHGCAPALPKPPAIGAQFTAVLQAGSASLLGQREFFDDVRHRASDQTKVDSLGRSEADGFDGLRRQATMDRREVGGQDHVAALLQHPDLFGQSTGRPSHVGLGDDAEDHLARCLDVDHLRAERAKAAAKTQIDRHSTRHQPDIPRRHDCGTRRREGQHSSKE